MGISYYELIFFSFDKGHISFYLIFVVMNISIITYFLILKILFCMHLQLHISHKKVLETEKFLSTQQTQHVVQLILYFSKECMNLHNDNMRKMTTDFTKKNHCRKLIPFNLILFILLVDVLFDIENKFLTTKAAQKSVVSSSSILKDSRKKMEWCCRWFCRIRLTTMTRMTGIKTDL